MTKAVPLIVYIPDRRDVEVSGRFTAGNNKIGYSVFTYSRLAGKENIIENIYAPGGGSVNLGTCPGSTPECEAICYAKRIRGAVHDIYVSNSETDDVPPIPEACQILRIHVSGDFNSVAYINNWIARLEERPDVTCWAYTRGWRVPALLPALERLRALPNVQLFASMDASCAEMPPSGWRRAWIFRAAPKNGWGIESRLDLYRTPIRTGADEGGNETYRLGELSTRCNVDQTPSYVCPEETGRKANCIECGYCFEGRKHDVTFLEH
jgi:hypothetical protein